MKKVRIGNNLLIRGECINVMSKMRSDALHTILADGPYALGAKGFMGQAWDKFSQLEFYKFYKEWAKEAVRILRPGGYAVLFCASQTSHRLKCGLEDAGFIIKGEMQWLYSNGMPRGNEIADNMRKLGLDPKIAAMWEGWHMNLSPAHEVIILAQKKITEKNIALNVAKWGTGAMNIGGCLVPYANELDKSLQPSHSGRKVTSAKGGQIGEPIIGRKVERVEYVPKKREGRFPKNVLHDGSEEIERAFAVFGNHPSAKSPSKAKSEGKIFKGKRAQGNLPGDDGGALRFFYAASMEQEEQWQHKNAVATVENHLFLKDLAVVFVQRLVAIAGLLEDKRLRNFIRHFIREMQPLLRNKDERRMQTILSSAKKFLLEWLRTKQQNTSESPAVNVEIHLLIGTMTIIQNLINSNGFVDPAIYASMLKKMERGEKDLEKQKEQPTNERQVAALRAFYCAKPSTKERTHGLPDAGNVHPTVKPIRLMRYLVRLFTPRGGIVLDTFLGSGTTLMAASIEGMRAVGIEREKKYFKVAVQRIQTAVDSVPMVKGPHAAKTALLTDARRNSKTGRPAIAGRSGIASKRLSAMRKLRKRIQ